MYEVSVSGRFSATHRLGLADGTFEPLHGHDWRVTATFAGPKLNALGVLLDFSWAKPRLDELLRTLHNRDLNDPAAFPPGDPSAENVAAYVAGQLSDDLPEGVRLRCVVVEEAPGCVVRYFPEAS